MKDRAYAKINLSLDITGKRPDGYHEIDSLMVPITLWDELDIVKSDKDQYSCNIPIPFDEKNTVVKAVRYIRERYSIHDHFKVKLYKRTPTQAGLGGGSSDGAAALRILDRMYHLYMNEKDIKEACLSIGADVLFTYYNKPARVKGIGEKLDFFDVSKKQYVLLVKPRAGVSTKEAYESLNFNLCDHPDIETIEKALIEGKEYRNMLSNSLEEPSLRLCEDIKMVKKKLEETGCIHPLMSGSGSTVFALSENKEELFEIKKKIAEYYPFVYVAAFLKKAQ